MQSLVKTWKRSNALDGKHPKIPCHDNFNANAERVLLYFTIGQLVDSTSPVVE